MRLYSPGGETPPEFEAGKLLPMEVAARWLKACGRETKIYSGSRLVSPARISVGSFSQIDEGVFIFGGEGVNIGDHVHFSFGSSVSGGGVCEIEDFVGLSTGVRLITGTDLAGGEGLTNPTIPALFRAVSRGRVQVGAHALLFANVVVLPNVTIGQGAVIGANSIVHRDLTPWAIYAGNPLVQVGVRPKEKILALADELRRLESQPD